MLVPSDHAGEDGLTLVEMLVAIVVIGFILMAMAGVAFASLRSVQTTERVTNATQLGSELLETYVALPYDELGLYATAATTAFGGTTFDGAPLVLFPDPISPDPRIPLPTQTITRGGVDYEVTTAVVWVDDTAPEAPSAQDYKRIVVQAEWPGPSGVQRSQVEALRAPGPTDQPLSVTVTPDLVELDDDGEQRTPVTITVDAKEPQTTVTVQWIERDGTVAGPTTMSDEGGRLQWSLVIDGHDFANGATLFTVTGTVSGTTEREVTTLGRGLFLQDLKFVPGGTTLTPAVVTYQPAFGADPGQFCTDVVRVDTEVDGAILSDPVTATIRPLEANPLSLPLTGDQTPTTRGTRFWVDIAVGDLDITEAGDVPVRLTAIRPVGAVQSSVSVDVAIDAQPTAALYEDDEDDTLITGYAPCP